MLDATIILSFLILVTLLSIKFGFGYFLSTFAAVVFTVGFFLVLFLYFHHQPKIYFAIVSLENSSKFNDLHRLQITIKDSSNSSLHHKEMILYLEKGTLNTSDEGAEIVGFYSKNKNIDWPYTEGIRVPMNDFKNENNKSAVIYSFPLLVPKNHKSTEIDIVMHLHANPYNSGILAIFNPIYNYEIKQKVIVELTKFTNKSTGN